MKKKKYETIVDHFEKMVSETISQYSYRDMWINYLHAIFHSKFYKESVYQDVNHFEPYIMQGAKILDFGAGGGYMSMFFAHQTKKIEALEYCDPDECKPISQTDPTYNMAVQQKHLWEKISTDYPVIHFSHYSGGRIPFENCSFDVVIAYAVLEHIPASLLGHYCDELRRVLKPGGTLLISYLPRRLAYMEHLARWLKMGSHENLFDDRAFPRFMACHGFEKLMQGRKNLFPAYPSRITNLFFPVLRWIEPLLCLTPLLFFAHNIWGIYRKTDAIFASNRFERESR